MSELDDVKKNYVELELFGKTRRLQFGMRALEKLEIKFGDVNELGTIISTSYGKNIPAVLYCMLKPMENDDITEDNIADAIDEKYTFGEIKNIVSELVKTSMPEVKGTPQKAGDK